MTYQAVNRAFCEAMSRGGEIADAESVVGRIKDLPELCASILASPDVLARIARNSFLHQDGFNKFVLLSNDEQKWRLRLHVWWPHYVRQLRVNVNVHNHAWDHASLIVAGSMENRFYEVMAGDDMVYSRSTSKGTPYERSVVIGSRSIRQVDVFTRAAGETYHQHHWQFHRIVPLTEFLATLCVQIMKDQGEVNTVTEAAMDVAGDVSHERPPRDHVIALLKIACDAVTLYGCRALEAR